MTIVMWPAMYAATKASARSYAKSVIGDGGRWTFKKEATTAAAWTRARITALSKGNLPRVGHSGAQNATRRRCGEVELGIRALGAGWSATATQSRVHPDAALLAADEYWRSSLSRAATRNCGRRHPGLYQADLPNSLTKLRAAPLETPKFPRYRDNCCLQAIHIGKDRSYRRAGIPVPAPGTAREWLVVPNGQR
jgi:hypothetical protein